MTEKNWYWAAVSAASAVGAAVASALGGWDSALETLVWLIGIDFTLGVLVALVWRQSDKSADGAFSSLSSWKGLLRKGGVLLVVLVAVRLDVALETGGYIRTAVILFFIANEGFSIIEKLGVMGVPMPNAVKEAFSSLKGSK